MADNIIAPAVGAIIATDQIGTTHYPRSKTGFGVEGEYVDVSADNPLPVAIVSGGGTGGGGGDASAANQATEIARLTSILSSVDGVEGLLMTLNSLVGGTLTVALPTGAATNAGVGAALAAQTYYPATQPISGTVGVAGTVPVSGTFYQATQPISATSLPLPAGAATETTIAAVLAKLIAAPATSAKQDTAIAAIGTVGTRAYAAGITALPVTTSSAASAAITATEVLLHASAKCFVRVGTAATVNDIPLEAGEKFTLRITSGQTINAITASGTATLNIVPVA